MSTYSESTGFTYDGIHSSYFGILNVHTNSGLFEEAFLPTRSIIEEKTFGRHEPYFFGFEYSPAELSLEFYFQDGWDEYKLNEVALWLYQMNYKPLVFDEDDSRIFYCMYEGDPKILHAGLKQGYISIKMRCNSPFSYTPVDIREETFTNNTLGTEIELFNVGHTECYPTITIEKTGTGDISITNLGIIPNKEFKFTGLLNGEIVTVDCENEDIVTSLVNTYRYSNFSNNYIKLPTGINTLKIIGDAKITFAFQSKRYI
jgi:phage-related protein